jgi:hypothetical protein
VQLDLNAVREVAARFIDYHLPAGFFVACCCLPRPLLTGS